LQDSEEALQVIHDVATENMGALCVTEPYRSLRVLLATSHYEGAQQKADMAAMLLQDLGVSHHNGKLAKYITSLSALHSILIEVLVVLTRRLVPQVRREPRKRRQNVCV
jgi:hypothetical protein